MRYGRSDVAVLDARDGRGALRRAPGTTPSPSWPRPTSTGTASTSSSSPRAAACSSSAARRADASAPRRFLEQADARTSSPATRCPRLRAYCREVARVKRRAFQGRGLLGTPGPRLRRSRRAPPARGPGTGGARREPHGARVHRRPLGGLPLSPRFTAWASPTSRCRWGATTASSLRDVYIAAAAAARRPTTTPAATSSTRCAAYLTRELGSCRACGAVALGEHRLGRAGRRASGRPPCSARARASPTAPATSCFAPGRRPSPWSASITPASRTRRRESSRRPCSTAGLMKALALAGREHRKRAGSREVGKIWTASGPAAEAARGGPAVSDGDGAEAVGARAVHVELGVPDHDHRARGRSAPPACRARRPRAQRATSRRSAWSEPKPPVGKKRVQAEGASLARAPASTFPVSEAQVHVRRAGGKRIEQRAHAGEHAAPSARARAMLAASAAR